MANKSAVTGIVDSYLVNEQKTKLKDLFKFFCNHVFLGQWELAKSAIPKLIKELRHSDVNVDFIEMLIDISEFPFSQSLGSITVPTPHHLSWLCLSELKKIPESLDPKLKSGIDRLIKDVDFRLTLAQLKDADTKVIQELYVYFKRNILKVRTPSLDEDRERGDFLSKATMKELKRTMLTSPALCDSIIRALMPENAKAESRDCEMLQGIYIDCLNSLLDNVEAGISLGLLESELEQLTSHMLLILASHDPLPYWNYLQLRQLFTRLLRLCLNQEGLSLLTIEEVVSVLYRRKTTYLLDEVCKIYHEVCVLSTVKNEESYSDFLTDDHRVNLHLLKKIDRNECWRDFFITCQKRQSHFLGEILDLSLSLIRAGKFMALQDLLSFPELLPLRAPVLLIGWSQCGTFSQVRTLLDTLWDDSAENLNVVLKSTCRKLVYHLDLIQWCLERVKSGTEGPETSGSFAIDMLRDLETHSVLHILQRFTNLASLDHAEILQLLMNLPDKKEEKKQKTVTFKDQSKQKDQPEAINVEQQRDIAIFRSYCALKNVMDALLFSADNSDHELMNPVKVKRTVKVKSLQRNFMMEQSLSSSEGDDSSSPGLNMESKSEGDTAEKCHGDSDQFLQSYENMVTKKLKEAKEHLSHIQPLTFRLEILENIFSLLFVTHEDLLEHVSGTSEPDSGDENDDSKRSSSVDIAHDSLNMSLVSEDETVGDDSLFEKAKSLSPAPSSPLVPSPQPASSGVDYDEPFVDPLEKTKSLSPVAETNQSSYFTLDSKLQKKVVEETSKQKLRDEIKTLTKKVKRKRKRESSSEQSSYPQGFLGNEYLVRDILHLLKDAAADLNAAKFSLSGKVVDMIRRDSTKYSPVKLDPELEKVLQSSSITTIQPETLQKRITKLMQAVHEAWWRFQLVSHEAFPKQPGRILVEKITVTDDDINFLPLCDRKVFSSDIEERSGIESECVNSPNRRLSSVGTLTPPSNIVTKMTAPPERLLILTLIKNNHQQAAEVIKLFRLTEKTAETCEVAFADIYKNRSAEIWDLETERREATPVPQRVGKRSVKALSRAAAIGVASASLSHITEDLLAASCLPPIPRPKTAYARENFGYLFNLDTPSAVLIDLLCTSCRTWDTCSNMMDIIKTRSSKLLEHDPRRTSAMTSLSSSSQSDTWSTHQNELSSPSSSVSSPPSISHGHGKPKHLKPSLRSIVGCTEFVWQLHDLVHLEDTSSSSFHVGARPLQLPRLSLQQRLNSGHMSLQADGIRSIEMATVELRRAMDRLLTVLSGTGPGRQLDISIEDPQPSPAPSPSTRGSSPGSFSGSTSSNVTPSLKNQPKQEQNLLHVAFKSLMCAMEKYIPGEGFAQLMNGKAFKVMSPPLKNYLLSLYEHVREMAYLVSECEGKNKDLLGNYFKVLDEGPVDVLGRLLFVKKMPPARLEAVAEKLSLNLTHTIVYSCCPRIPSKHAAVTAAELDECCKLWGSTVANVSAGDKDSLSSTTADSTLTGEKPRHPELVVREMLVQVVKMMKKYAKTHSAHGVFDIACAKNLVREQDYLAAVKMTSRLRSLDLNMLTSGDERICFFANLANLMVIHCHLAKILSRLELLLKQEEKGGNGDEEQIELFPLAAADNLMYLSSFSFSVGQLGVVSVFDILNVLCRSGLAAASQWRDLLGCRTLKLDPQDSWGQHAPPPESRLIFVLNSGCISSPPLVVLNPDHVQTQLEMAMKDYLSHTVRVSVDQERVCLPQLLMWHEHDFVADKELVVDTRHSALVKWMTPYLSAETQNRLEQLFLLDSVHGFSENIDVSGKNELPFRVETDPFDNTFSFTFGVTHVKVGSPSTMPSVVAPVSKKTKAPAALFSNSLEAAGMGQSLQLPKYNLTPVTLEYVKHDSLLAATMVSLVCADNLDNIEQQFTDDHFNVPELTPAQQHLEGLPRPHRSSSDISLVDIRSYRYQRLTNDYPVLQRHLLQYILPLAGADHPELLESREPILKFVTNDIEDQVKLCMFSLADSEQFQGVIHDMANRLLEERKWMELLTMLGSLPSSVISEFSPLQVLHDFSLSCWAISHVKLPGQAPKVGDRLRWFYNPTLQARIVLTVTYSLPLDLASDLLDLCIHGLEESSGLWQAVVSRKKEIGIHSKIMASVKRLHIKLSTQDASVLALNDSEQQLLAVVEELRDWRSIPKVSADRPADILLVLEQTMEFDVAAEWAEMNKLAPDTIQEIKKRHLTSLLSGSQPDTVTAFQVSFQFRRLRDKLIADERLKLAMEVSTKCGIDPAGVWAAMGFARLHLGDYQGAREKFGHCLKVPTDKNKPWPSQSRLIGEIIDFLDTIPSSGLTEVEKLLRDPSNICDIKTLLVPSVGEENRVESVPYQECLFYLRTYGSFMDHISFLRQHSYWMKAVQFASDRHCSADVFVTGLVVPAMSSGEMGRLLEQMLMLDPTLEKWLVYLTATCKHLLRQKYFHSLYQVQLFMKDYIRASMTCVSYFYQRGARTYLDLCGRLQFLFTAQQHLQAYLDPSQWGSVRHPLAPVTPVQGSSRQQLSWDKSSADTAARMTLSTDEVKKHIRIIALQIEVTKFLEQCITQSLGSVDGSGPRAGSQQLPTLFGSNTAKTELVSLVILSGQKLSTGFELGVRIVKEFRLDPTHIFTHCSRELAKQGRFSDINVLIQNLLLQGMVTDETIDEIVGASLLVIANSHTHSQAKDESDTLIQLLRNDSNKINALILCGKLRSAYLLAVKRERVEDVQRIAGAAQRLGQSAVTNICRKWLEQHHVSQKKL
ncbi:zinc finger FYVE domain-containing protein 26 [Aplysia californica]|uniref:Zinc finger FYVE domain-containing protein 26 n=1 Tax=Aplysia californica TaxID=6500 RepID=A0ABM1VZ84_APLCA|nr:zinc finger FYVE domain-containing protein 26 [Aplysia californica]